ncbi:hypothetical protein LQK79_08650 [Clostridium guangxiense]|nr:hypothetical protein [Clostridium guangxiense]
MVSLYVNILLDNTITYNFFLDYDGRINVDQHACGEFNISKMNGWGTIEDNFKKKLCIDVIIELIKQNNIQIGEIQQAITKL